VQVPAHILVLVDIIVIEHIDYCIQCPILVGEFDIELLLDPLENIGHVSDDFFV